jgi:putative acyl-CoA dehydrogenase
MSSADNLVPPLYDYNAFDADEVLREAVLRERAYWITPDARSLGALVTTERLAALADAANRNLPELQTFDRLGRRVDRVIYHDAYHELMSLAFGHGLHSLAWTARREGAFVARAAMCYLWNQLENGTSCPVTMTFAGVAVLQAHAPALADIWIPRLTASAYDPRPIAVGDKTATIMGMAMTEKQGGSDLRANETRAVAGADTAYRLSGHKWFCSAPMSDAFLTLARSEEGLTCFFVPRWLPDGSANPFQINRLKDKCGNRSNASSEIEYHGTWALRVGEEGRGIATLIEMAHLTRFDIVVAIAGMMRGMLVQALHHCRHRCAFGKPLVEQPLMQNVLADLCLEWEAASLLAFRLARAFDAAAYDPKEKLLSRLLTPVAKYWLAKRNPAFMAEAMECLGGNGFTEEWPLARFYREAPLNGIWEGSGNVICLDVLRVLRKEPDALAALLAEVQVAAADEPRLQAWLDRLQPALSAGENVELRARYIVESLALAVQAALMLRHAPAFAADAFCVSRLANQWGKAWGTLPAGVDCAAIVRRAAPA